MPILTDEQRTITGLRTGLAGNEYYDLVRDNELVPCSTIDGNLRNYINQNLKNAKPYITPPMTDEQQTIFSTYWEQNFHVGSELYCINGAPTYFSGTFANWLNAGSATDNNYIQYIYHPNGTKEQLWQEAGLRQTGELANDDYYQVQVAYSNVDGGFNRQPNKDTIDYSKVAIGVEFVETGFTAGVPSNDYPLFNPHVPTLTSYAINRLYPYHNDNDGSYSASNQRPSFGPEGPGNYYTLALLAETDELPLYDENDEPTGAYGKLQCMVRIDRQLLGGLGPYNGSVNSYGRIRFPLWFSYEPLWLTNLGLNDSYSPNAVSHLLGTKAELSRLINMLNLPWTDDPEQILNRNSVNFTHPDPADPLPNIPDPVGPDPDPDPEPGDPTPGTGGQEPTKPGFTGGGGVGPSGIVQPTIPSTTGTLTSGGRCYAISRSYISTLRQALSTSDFGEWSSLMFKGDPNQAIINLIRFPFKIEDVANVSANVRVSVAGTEVYYKSGSSNMYPMAGIVDSIGGAEFQMGTLEVAEPAGSFLSYAPYTSITLFLPYIGFRELDVNTVMGRTIALRYVVSFADGSCTAILKVNGLDTYTWGGQLGTLVPMSTNNSMQKTTGTLGAVLSSGVTAAAGVMTGNPALAMMGAAGAAQSVAQNAAAPTTLSNKGTAMLNMGDFTTNVPYIIITRPEVAMPSNEATEKIKGFRCNIYSSLEELTGFTQCANVKLNGIPATQAELDEIRQLLESGVIL